MHADPLGITLAVAALMLFVHGTLKKTRFGINFTNVFCPVCRVMVPMLFSKPRTLGQLVWGGATCNNCECQMDKWGEPVRMRAPRFMEEIE